jgi:hypothetical protein
MSVLAIKAGIRDRGASTFEFSAQKTMYGGKHIAQGHAIFLFARARLAERPRLWAKPKTCDNSGA